MKGKDSITNPFNESHETLQDTPNPKVNSQTKSSRSTPSKRVQRAPLLKRPLNSSRTSDLNTSEDRARSSLNAVKHGGYVTAKTAGLGYQQILDELTQRINPVGAVDRHLALSTLNAGQAGGRAATVRGRRRGRHPRARAGARLPPGADAPRRATQRNPPQLANRLATFLESQLASLHAQRGGSPSDSDLRTIVALRHAVLDMSVDDDDPDEAQLVLLAKQCHKAAQGDLVTPRPAPGTRQGPSSVRDLRQAPGI